MMRLVYIGNLEIQFDDEAFRIFGRCLELFYITGGIKENVCIIAEAEFSKDGMYMYGFVSAAEVVYTDPAKYVVHIVSREGN